MVRPQHGESHDGKETHKGHKTAWSAKTTKSVMTDGDDEIDALKGARGHRAEAARFRHATSE